MTFFRNIQWKALVLLTVFSANLYAVCQCHHKSIAQPAVKNCCAAKHAHPEAPGCPDKNGCRNDQSIKFSLLDKQTVEKIVVSDAPILSAATITAPVLFTGTAPRPSIILPVWRSEHAPPDLQSLYQRFLI